MPSSAKDRFTVDFEKVFFFTKSSKYYFEQQFEINKSMGWEETNNRHHGNGETSRGKGFYRVGSILQGRNMRCVWDIPPRPFKEAHFATYPEALIAPMIKAGCPEGGIVLDPFIGSGTTAVVAKKLGRQYIGIELNPEYIALAQKRIAAIGERLGMERAEDGR